MSLVTLKFVVFSTSVALALAMDGERTYSYFGLIEPKLVTRFMNKFSFK